MAAPQASLPWTISVTSESFGDLGASESDSPGQFRYSRRSEPGIDDLGLSGNKVAFRLGVDHSLESGMGVTIVRGVQSYSKQIGQVKGLNVQH